MSSLKDTLAEKKAAFLAKADDDGSREKAEIRPATPAAPVDKPTPAPTPAPARQKPAKTVGYPWQNANPKIKPQFTLRMPEELHLKLGWVAERSPESMQKIALEAVRAEVEKRVRELVKAEKE